MTKTPLSLQETYSVLREAELLYPAEAVERALEHMAHSITHVLESKNPLVLAVMIGGIVPVGRLLPKLKFPLELDYVHATRYQGRTEGKDLVWRARPATSLEHRVVLVVDDILDAGITLAGILSYCAEAGAQEVYSAVLVEKQRPRPPIVEHADFTGLVVDDRYVFGCGMDYRGYLRNMSGIYAVKGM